MGYLSPIPQIRNKSFPQQEPIKENTVSPDFLEKMKRSDPKTDLEIQAEQLLGPNKLTMLFANPNSELFLAMLARVVVFIISGRSKPPEKGVNPPKNFDPTQCSVNELLRIRNEKV